MKTLVLLIVLGSFTLQDAPIWPEEFIGRYYYVQQHGDEYALEENCWTKNYDQVSIEENGGEGASECPYLISFEGQRVYTYGILSAKQEGDTVTLHTVDANYIGEEWAERHVFKIYPVSEYVMAIAEIGIKGMIYMTRVEFEEGFEKIPCAEEE